MHNPILRAKIGEACLLGCQNFQIIKTSMILVPMRGWSNHVEDDPEAPVIYSVFHLTGKWDVASNCIWLFLIFGFLLAMAGWILDDLNDLHPWIWEESANIMNTRLESLRSWQWLLKILGSRKEEEKEQCLGEEMPGTGCSQRYRRQKNLDKIKFLMKLGDCKHGMRVKKRWLTNGSLTALPAFSLQSMIEIG